MKLALLCLLSALACFAQTIPGRYIIEMDTEPAAGPSGATRRAQIRAEHLPVEGRVRALGGSVIYHYDTVVNGMAVQVPDAMAANLRAMPGVKGVYPDKMWHKVLDHALPVHRITDAWAAIPGGMANAGAGMKIAILDEGIDVTHPGFQGFNTPLPAGFPKASSDAEMANTNSKVIVSRDYTGSGGMDTGGHGTGVAMIAAGVTNNAAVDYLLFDGVTTTTIPIGPITGVAPAAWLGNYKVCGNSGCAVSAFLQALQDAVNDGMNVINYSVGGPVLNASDESGLQARAVRGAIAAGALVVVAAGDDGASPSGGQAPSTVAEPAIVPDAITVGATGNSRIFFWAVVAPGMAPILAEPADPSQDVNPVNVYDPVNAPLADVAAIDGTGYACDALPAGSLNGKIALIQRSVVGSAAACAFNTKLNNAAAAGALGAVVFNSVPDGLLFMLLSDTTLPGMFISQTDGQKLQAQIAASPGLTVTMDFAGLTPFALSSDYVAVYSPAGPTPSGAIKPDLMAVGGYDACTGDEVFTADTAHATAVSSPCGNGEMVNNPAHPYVTESGTSFSAPFVTGAAAVLMAARPGLSAAQYKSLLVNTAPQFVSAVDGSKVAPTIGGSGKLDLLGAIQSNLAVSPVSLNFLSGNGTVNSTLPLVFTNVGSATDAFTVTVNSIDGATVPTVDASTFTLAPGASRTINVSMVGSALPAGAYDGHVAVTGTQSPIATRVAYWYGSGSGQVQNISVLNQNQLNSGGSPLSTATILIRCTDKIGIPTAGATPTVTALAARARVLKVYTIGDIPGTYGIDVQLGRSANTADEFDVTVGDLTAQVFVGVF